MDALARRAHQAKAWLFDAALPLWWARGYDPTHGGYYERLNLDATPADTPRRARVQSRQTFVYALAGKLGWNGPWREAASAGVDTMLTRCTHPNGGVIHMLDARGQPSDLRRDLYDTAFAIFALAHAGDALARPELIAQAEALSDWTYANWARENGGLHEGEVTPIPPRRQNPHMHMLEAQIALAEISGAPRHAERARDLAALFRTRFFSPTHGALLEFFNEDWAPAPGDEGRICEPGHQFEWSWLLDRYRRLTGDDLSAEADSIYGHGERFGVIDGVTVDETWAEGGVKAPTSRLWTHTERMKANLVRVERTSDAEAAARATEAFDVMMRYCETPTPGMWRDRLRADGSFVDEPAPASTFYHIMVAMAELIRVVDLRG